MLWIASAKARAKTVFGHLRQCFVAFLITLKIVKTISCTSHFLNLPFEILKIWWNTLRNLYISSNSAPPHLRVTTENESLNALKWSTYKQNNNYPTTCLMTLWIMSSIFLDWLNTRHLWPSDLRFSKSDTKKAILPDSWVSTLSDGPNPFGWVANEVALCSSVSNSTSLENENLHYVNN